AFGIAAVVTGFASGSVINEGLISVSAVAGAPARAVGETIKGSGFWTGALVNNSIVEAFASDPVRATAVGMGIAGTVTVDGGIENRGTIEVEAVSSTSAIARAIDLSKATGTGHTVHMLDGFLGAVTRSTKSGPTSVGTGVFLGGNGQTDQLDWSGGV